MKKLILFITLCCLANQTIAGKVKDTFSDGLFKVKWGSTLEEVKSVYPVGKKNIYGKIVQFEVNHQEAVLKIERKGLN